MSMEPPSKQELEHANALLDREIKTRELARMKRPWYRSGTTVSVVSVLVAVVGLGLSAIRVGRAVEEEREAKRQLESLGLQQQMLESDTRILQLERKTREREQEQLEQRHRDELARLTQNRDQLSADVLRLKGERESLLAITKKVPREVLEKIPLSGKALAQMLELRHRSLGQRLDRDDSRHVEAWLEGPPELLELIVEHIDSVTYRLDQTVFLGALANQTETVVRASSDNAEKPFLLDFDYRWYAGPGAFVVADIRFTDGYVASKESLLFRMRPGDYMDYQEAMRAAEEEEDS